LTCPETGRKFPVTKGIPNMLLHEDEVWDVCCFFRLGFLFWGDWGFWGFL
jgi:hypothetical protein